MTVLHLIGPGGAGKSTTGAILASRLGFELVDLDAYFMEHTADISSYLDDFGYEAYATQNFQNYLLLSEIHSTRCVFVLSSGFMVYPSTINSCYSATKADIEASSCTFVLLPSFDLETCVRETVRRQTDRPYLPGNEYAEEQRIRRRFPIYMALASTKIETSTPPDEVAALILSKADLE